MKYLNRDKLRDHIEHRMAADRADGRVGAAGICVMQGGEVMYKQYFGRKSYDAAATDIAVSDRSVFRLASMTKPITAAAVLIQVGRGLIDLDEPVSHMLPGFAEMDIGAFDEQHRVIRVGKAKTQLTPRILLCHANGLGAMEIGDVQSWAMTAEDRQDIAHVVDFLAGTALAFEPMTAQFYSPVAAFDVVARMVELTSGQPFDVFLKENIFDPCGMTDTAFAPTPDQWSRMVAMHDRVQAEGDACGHSVDTATVPGCVFENIPVTWFSGGAGLASTLPDYVRFAEMLCRGGRVGDRQVVPEHLVRAMGTPWVPESIMPGPQQWGLGVRVITSDDYQLPKHCFGWSGAYGTHFWVDPVNQITATYMKNSRYDGGSGALTALLFEQDVYAAL